jgi:hypothetical protein
MCGYGGGWAGHGACPFSFKIAFSKKTGHTGLRS